MPEIEIHEPREEDRSAILAFCAHTWEWGDYIEQKWDEWLSDPAGVLLAAFLEERPVGIVHIQMLTETEAWLEGMRVDPYYRQQGIARRLSEEAMAEAMRRGATIIRLLTDSTNEASMRLFEQARFQPVGTFALYTAPPLDAVPRSNTSLDKLVQATTDDLDQIIAYLDISSIFPAVGGIYYSSFIGHRISDTLLRTQIESGHILLLRRWDRLDGLVITEPRESQEGAYLFIGYIDGTTESISLIAYTLRQKLTSSGQHYVRANVPDLIMVRDAFSGAEYEWKGSTFTTYERGLV